VLTEACRAASAPAPKVHTHHSSTPPRNALQHALAARSIGLVEKQRMVCPTFSCRKVFISAAHGVQARRLTGHAEEERRRDPDQVRPLGRRLQRRHRADGQARDDQLLEHQPQPVDALQPARAPGSEPGMQGGWQHSRAHSPWSTKPGHALGSMGLGPVMTLP